MRLILERAEVVAILGKHFDVELDPEKVVIRTDPFEIEVYGLPLASETASTSSASPTRRQRADTDAFTDSPPPNTEGVLVDTTGTGLHPAAALAVSKELERQLDLENPGLASRRSGRWSEKAPTRMDEEL